jgi:acetolactate synthase-1/2/3 large subunit
MERLQASGVTTIFGQSIPAAALQLAERFGIRQIGYRTENAGGVMADGYARITSTLGLVAAQNGPAATLLVPPFAEAMKASTPLLGLVQDVPRTHVGRNAFQEYDHHALFSGCTKWVGRVERADQLEHQLDMAIRQALGGRPGPVVLLLPMDLLSERTLTEFKREPLNLQFPLARSVPQPSQVELAAAILAGARKPLIVAGGGVHLSGACAALGALQELGVPVATTNMGKGAVSDLHPLSMGVIGNCMEASAPIHGCRAYIDAADVVLLVGTRTNQNATDSWRLFSTTTKFIHIDIDFAETGRNYDSLSLVGDARESLVALTRAMRNLPAPRFEPVTNLITESRRQAKVDLQERLVASADGVRPEALMARLAELLPEDAVVAADASYSTNWVVTYLPVRKAGDRFLLPRGLAGLGWGVPLAMGAKVARPEAFVVAVVGDGGFGHVWSELEAARRQGINITVIVFNNGVLGYQKHAEERDYGASTDACDFGPVDHAQVAQACGCVGITVKHQHEIEAALRQALGAKGPVLIDVITDPTAKPPLSAFASSRQ